MECTHGDVNVKLRFGVPTGKAFLIRDERLNARRRRIVSLQRSREEASRQTIAAIVALLAFIKVGSRRDEAAHQGQLSTGNLPRPAWSCVITAVLAEACAHMCGVVYCLHPHPYEGTGL